MIYKLIFLGLTIINVLGAPTFVPPSEKQQPTVIPIVSQSEELEPNGTYSFSYETGNGIKREETSYDKIIPKATSRSASSEESEESDYDNNSNEIHVQRGSYSYTAPDGSIITLSYIADENGFQPVGKHLPRPPAPVSITANIISKSKSVLKALDNSGSDSVNSPLIKPLNSVPIIAPRLADKGILSESTTRKNSETSTVSKSLENSATTEADIVEQNSMGTESAVSGSSESDNNSDISEQGNNVSTLAEISTISPFQSKAISEDSGTTVLNSFEPEGKSVAAESSTSSSLHSAESSTTESTDMETSPSTDKLEDAATPSNVSADVKQIDSQSQAPSHGSLTETDPDAEDNTTLKPLYTSDSSEDKTTNLSGEETTVAIKIAGDTTEEAKNLVFMEEVTENVVDGSTLTNSDATNDGTEPTNEKVSTLASST